MGVHYRNIKRAIQLEKKFNYKELAGLSLYNV